MFNKDRQAAESTLKKEKENEKIITSSPFRQPVKQSEPLI
jgi:hypothetical protein